MRNVAEMLKGSVSLELESIDRMYLNAYVPRLQTPEGLAGFVRCHLGLPVVSTAAVAPRSRAFIAAVEAFAEREGVDLLTFEKGVRKDDVAHEYLARFRGREGVLFIGKAQEKVKVFRTERRTNRQTGFTYPWVVPGTAMVNQYYFYLVDADFGPLFLKFSSYFPYTAKLCLNGHEWLKRQLTQRRIRYQALDNGILSCADPRALQRIADSLSAAKIDALFRKWLARLPHPYTAADRRAGYRYDLSILQAEFSLTQVLDRPETGRQFFEEMIREHLDLGRPDQVQLLFSRRITRRTPGRFRTRVITHGVVPSLHIDYKQARIKQYHKEGRALRTECTINNSRDFGIGKRLENLPALREIGFTANRRLLDVQTMSHDCRVGVQRFRAVIRPHAEGSTRVSALPFGAPRVMALMHALVVFSLLPQGFANRDLRERVAPLLGVNPAQWSPGRMTYDLRRLRIHGLIQRIPRTHRYRVTPDGFRIALLFSRTYSRVLRTGLSLAPAAADENPAPPRDMQQLDQALEHFINERLRIAA
jgi:hypothetical protein